MPATTEDELVAHVAAHAGDHADIAAVRAATHATLSVIGAYTTPAIRALVADELAPSLGSIVVRAEAGKALPIQEHVLTPEMTVARADELIASALTVLAEELSDDVLERLQRELPDKLARRLVRPAIACRARAGSPAHETLAEGRAGSRRPVGEEHVDRTQHDSVASDNPHGDVKLSSAIGTTQEREHETLAEGRPGSTRPLAETRK